MQRIKVDLPDPEGPQITILSPFKTFRLMSRRTWKSPYHLFTSIISTATSVADPAMCERLARETFAGVIFSFIHNPPNFGRTARFTVGDGRYRAAAPCIASS